MKMRRQFVDLLPLLSSGSERLAKAGEGDSAADLFKLYLEVLEESNAEKEEETMATVAK